MDLNVTMGDEIEQPAPTEQDKSMIDNLKHEAKPRTPSPIAEVSEEVETELEVKPVVDDDEIIFKETKEVVKKKPASSKQAEHLKKAREKALATRRAKAKIRNEEKEKKALERKMKRELKEKQLIEKEEAEHQIKMQSKQVKVPEQSTPSSMRSLSESQILDLQEKAISNYEVKRKAAKEVKKKKQNEEAQQAKIYQSINKAINPDPDDIWGVCFQ